ncbi:MAG: hypothetical protein NC483_06285 [Ruminococcus sp.]|nr:hypothetical protein [Ruminococcus sp.]
MKLKLKKEQIGNFEDEELCTGVISRNLEQIARLKSLQEGLGELDDAAFIKKVLECYKVELDSKDLRKISEVLLQSKNLELRVIKTNLKTPCFIQNKMFGTYDLEAIIYSSRNEALDINKIYTKQELEELVKSKKIVIIGFTYGRHSFSLNEIDEEQANEYKKIPSLEGANHLENLGESEGLVVRKLKNKLQRSRIAKDICRIIEETRYNITGYKNEVSKSRTAENRLAGDYLAAYLHYLDVLANLDNYKKEVLKRTRK